MNKGMSFGPTIWSRQESKQAQECYSYLCTCQERGQCMICFNLEFLQISHSNLAFVAQMKRKELWSWLLCFFMGPSSKWILGLGGGGDEDSYNYFYKVYTSITMLCGPDNRFLNYMLLTLDTWIRLMITCILPLDMKAKSIRIWPFRFTKFQ